MNRPRRWTLLDAMILVAAMAPGILLGKAYLRCYPVLPYYVSGEHDPWRLGSWARLCGLVPMLAILTVALLLPRWLPPRPRLRRLFRLPGTTASLVAALAGTVALAQAVGDWPVACRIHHPNVGMIGPDELLALRLVGLKDRVGPGVAFAWAWLGLGGGWRPEASWIDRAGRIAGVVWIALGLASWMTGLID